MSNSIENGSAAIARKTDREGAALMRAYARV
jgi:hypothetical protein